MGQHSPRHAKTRWWRRRTPASLVLTFQKIELARKHGGGIVLADPVKERTP
jgi:hypothetical protein